MKNSDGSSDDMRERHPWHLDTETAKRECRETLEKWQAQIVRLRHLVEHSDEFAPPAFRKSVENHMPELRRATMAAVARLQIYVQILNGDMHWHEEKPEEATD